MRPVTIVQPADGDPGADPIDGAELRAAEAAAVRAGIGGERIAVYVPLVYNVCRRVLRRAADVDDAVQETFIKLAERGDQVHSSTVGWLHACARTTALDVAKRLRARERLAQPLDDRDIGDDTPPPGSHDADLVPQVDACLAELDADGRAVVLAYFYEDKTLDRIADEIGLSKSAVKKRLDRALETLRHRLRRRGVIAPIAIAALLGRWRADAAEPTAALRAAADRAYRAAATVRPTATRWAWTAAHAALGAGALVAVLAIDGHRLRPRTTTAPTPPTAIARPRTMAARLDWAAPIATQIVGGRPFALATAPDGAVYATLTDVDGVEVVAGAAPPLQVGLGPTDIAVSADGRRAYVTEQGDGAIGIYDRATGALAGRVLAGDNTFRVRPSHDGRRIFATVSTGELLVIDARSLAIEARIAVGEHANGLAVAADDRHVYVSARDAATVVEVDVDHGRIARAFAVGGRPQDLAITADGRSLYVADEDYSAGPRRGTVEIIALADGAIARLPVPGPAFAIALSPDDAVLVVSSTLGGRIAIVDTATRSVLREIPCERPRRIAFVDGGARALVADETGRIVQLGAPPAAKPPQAVSSG